MHRCRGEGATVQVRDTVQTPRCLIEYEDQVSTYLVRAAARWLGMLESNQRARVSLLSGSKPDALPLGESPTGVSFTGRPSSEHCLRLLL